MDFLDPSKQRAHTIRLIVGYVLVGVAILIATIILLYQAYGFGLDKDGEVIQNGLVFVSSQPEGAKIYLNTKLEKDTTNTKLQIPGGDYMLELQRQGYHSWERAIHVDGGSVEHFDYPLLFPAEPQPDEVKAYAAAPGLATQSPDRRWLLVQQPESFVNFDLYDLGDPERVTERIVPFTVPETILTSPRTGDHSWKLTEWANNNRHVVLEHSYPGGMEYILLDREEPERSVNLTRVLELPAGTVLSLRDKKHDRYYLFNAEARTLSRTELSETPTVLPKVDGVLGFKSYGEDKILYATEAGAADGMVASMLQDGEATYKIREHPAGGPYLLDMVRYERNWVVAVGSSADNRVYVYKNPQAVRKAAKLKNLVPVRVMKVPAPNYLSFSSNTQLLMVQNGTNFATYDLETERGYSFTAADPLDPPQTHASWMDGHRIVYSSGGKLVVIDYDNRNRRTWVGLQPGYQPFFNRNYRYLYTLSPGTGIEPAQSAEPAKPAAPAGMTLWSTSMLTAADQ